MCAIFDNQSLAAIGAANINLVVSSVNLGSISIANSNIVFHIKEADSKASLRLRLGANLHNIKNQLAIIKGMTAQYLNLVTIRSIDGLCFICAIFDNQSLAAIGAANINLIDGRVRLDSISIANRGLGFDIKERNGVSIVRKRCKRHAHDNHEHGSQQSQQTSFEVRFLHVNFSYSLKIYLKRFAGRCPTRTRLLAQ